MAYEKQTWVDAPDTSSPISAERLGHMETQYDEAIATLGPVIEEKVDALLVGASSGVAPLDANGRVPVDNLPEGSGGAASVISVTHGANAATARPTADMVFWHGSVEPANMVDGDIWDETV